MSFDQRQVNIDALNLFAKHAIDYFHDLGDDVLDRGVRAIVTPQEPVNARQAWLQRIQVAESPETLNALLKERTEQVGWQKMLAEFGQLSRPFNNKAQPDAAALSD